MCVCVVNCEAVCNRDRVTVSHDVSLVTLTVRLRFSVDLLVFCRRSCSKSKKLRANFPEIFKG